MTIKDGQVVRVNRRFSQDPKASRHPGVIVANDSAEIWIAICTDVKHRSLFPNSVNINYAECGLSKPTIVICDKLAKVHPSEITHIYGDLSYSDFKEVEYAVNKHHGLDKMFEYREVSCGND